jgi:N-methylhydantoinase A
MRLASLDTGALKKLLGEMKAQAAAFVQRGRPGAEIVYRVRAFMRYLGQGWEIPVELQNETAPGDEYLKGLFERAYGRLFGRVIPDQPIEIMSWVVRAATPLLPAPPVAAAPSKKPAIVTGSRRMFDAHTREYVESVVIDRLSMVPGDFVAGPAVVAEAETSTVVPSRFQATMLSDGALLLTRKNA